MNSKWVLPGISLLLLSAVPFEDTLGVSAVDAAWGVDESTSFFNFFRDAYRFEASVDAPYVSGLRVEGTILEDAEIKVIEEVSPTARYSRVTIAGEEAARTYVKSDEDGNAIEVDLGIDNVAVETPIMSDETTSATAISFEEHCPDWFAGFSTTESSAFSTYFNVEASSDGFIVTPNSRGLSVLSRGLNSFLWDLDGFNYDSKTASTSYLDLKFTTDSTGTPTSLSFGRIKKDRYGGIREGYEVRLTALDAVSEYPLVVSSMSDEEKADLAAAIDGLNAKLLGGNFTETISFHYGTQELTQYGYRNFYDLSGSRHLMLSENYLSDTTYGATYTGLLRESGSGYYRPIGISPDYQDGYGYFSALDNSSYYETLADAIPLIGKMSPEFFSYEGNGRYSYDPSEAVYADYYFNFELLNAAFGVGDYYSYRYTGSLYFANNNLSISDFSIVTSASADPYLEITFYSAAGVDLTVRATFSDFGTTDFSEISGYEKLLQIVDEANGAPTTDSTESA